MSENQAKKYHNTAAPHWVLSALFFFTGAHAITTQMYCVRELLVVFFGNELCLGILFGCWFLGIGIGSYYGARLRMQGTALMTTLTTGVLVLGLVSWGAIVVARLLRYVIAIPLGGSASVAHMAEGSFLTAFPPGVVIGLIFPLACAVLQERDSAGRTIGWVYLWESLGSLGAGVGVSFIAVPTYVSLTVVSFCALPLFATAGIAALLHRTSRALIRLGYGALLLAALDAVCLSTGMVYRFDSLIRELQWQTLKNGLARVAEQDSRYQRITLAEAGGQYSVFLNGTFWRAYPNAYQQSLSAHMLATQHPAPRQVLLLGAGSAGMLAELLKHPVATVDCVSLDPVLDQILEPVLVPADRAAVRDQRTTMHYQDSRLFVKQTPQHYELIIVDAPDPSTAFLNRLYTVDFFDELRRILTDNGMIAIGLSSEQEYFSKVCALYHNSLYQSLRQVFPHVMIIPGERNYFFAAMRSDLFTEDAALLARRYEQRGVVSEYFSAALFPFLVQREKITFMQTALDAQTGTVKLNTDLQPVTYFYNLVLWDIMAGSAVLAPVLLWLREQGQPMLLAIMTALVLAGVVLCRARGERFVYRTVVLLIITTGAAVMALEIVLVYQFQNAFGYVYEKIGAIVALCMVGLACGAGIARRMLRWCANNVRALRNAMLVVAGLLMTVALLTPLLVSTSSGNQYVYCCLVFLLGLLGGAQFPCACQMLVARGWHSSSVAGWLNAGDHLGACCGAVLTGTILMPVLGVAATCTMIGAALGTGIALFTWSVRT